MLMSNSKSDNTIKHKYKFTIKRCLKKCECVYMSKYKIWTPEEDNRLIELYNNSLTYKQISEKGIIKPLKS